MNFKRVALYLLLFCCLVNKSNSKITNAKRKKNQSPIAEEGSDFLSKRNKPISYDSPHVSSYPELIEIFSTQRIEVPYAIQSFLKELEKIDGKLMDDAADALKKANDYIQYLKEENERKNAEIAFLKYQLEYATFK